MNKIKVFESLLDKFETDVIRDYCKDMIEQIPDYIFTIPASTSLKYHNKTQCQPCGQIFHILMFGEIMNYILGLKYVQEMYHPIQRDCLRCTAIFHDAMKCGKDNSGHTVHEHPLLAADWVRHTIVPHDINPMYKRCIASLCETHNGQWSTSDRSNIKLPEPIIFSEFLVHLCDYLASRNNLDMIYSDDVLKAVQEHIVCAEKGE